MLRFNLNAKKLVLIEIVERTFSPTPIFLLLTRQERLDSCCWAPASRCSSIWHLVHHPYGQGHSEKNIIIITGKKWKYPVKNLSSQLTHWDLTLKFTPTIANHQGNNWKILGDLTSRILPLQPFMIFLKEKLTNNFICTSKTFKLLYLHFYLT